MTIALLKLFVTPLLMYVVTSASRRWGSSIGGLLSGMPLTSAPVSIFLTIEQGPRFAEAAAIGSIAGITAVMMFYVAYYLVSRFAGVPVTLGASLAVYVGSACLFSAMSDHGLLLAAIFLTAAAIILVASARVPSDAAVLRTPRWDMPARIIVSTGMVIAITVAAPVFGPNVTGVLAPIAIISWPLIVFAHVQQGRTQAVLTIRGTVQTSIGILGFYGVVVVLVETRPVLTYVLAVGASVCFAIPWFWLSLRGRSRIRQSAVAR